MAKHFNTGHPLPLIGRLAHDSYHVGLRAFRLVLARRPLPHARPLWAFLPDKRGLREGLILVGLGCCIAMELIWRGL